MLRERRRVLGFTLLAVPILALAGATSSTAPLGTVRINEVAWGGSPDRAQAEWIELTNVSDAPLDLAGWRLVSSDGSPDILLAGTLAKNAPSAADAGYLLLERDSDDAVPGITADLIYAGALADTGESLALYDASGRLVDTANFQGDGRWPAGTNVHGAPPCAPMERSRFDADDSPAVWVTSPAGTGGTPRAANASLYHPPVAVLRVDPPAPPPGRTATFDASGSFDRMTVVTRFEWDFGDGTGGTTTLPTVHHVYGEPGVYIVTLAVYNAAGDMSTFTLPLLVVASRPPTADFSVRSTSGRRTWTTLDPLRFCDESSDEEGALIAWSWDFGDGTTSELPSPEHAYSRPGEFVVTLRVRDAQGDEATYSAPLLIANRLPTAAFTVAPPVPDTGASTSFDASSSRDEDGTLATYVWDFDGDGTDDFTTSDPIVSHRIERCGIVTPRLVVHDDAGGRSLPAIVSLDVNCAPTAQFSVSSFALDETQTFSVGACGFDADGTLAQWHWSFGDGAEADSQTASHVYADAGEYAVVLVVTDDRGAEGQAEAVISVRNLPPTVSLSAAAASLETGTAFSFSATAVDPSPTGRVVAYLWDLDGDGTWDAETAAGATTRTYDDDGSFSVRVAARDDDGAESVATLAIQVKNRTPRVDHVVASPPSPADGDEVAFSATGFDPDGTIAVWRWEFGDGTSAAGQSVQHVFENDGAHTVRVTITDDDGAVAESSIVVKVSNAPPVAAFEVGTWTECAAGIWFDASASFDPSPLGSILHVAWDFGDGTTCPGLPGSCGSVDRFRPVHCYSEPGTYNVTLVVIDDQGDLTSVERNVIVPP
ncbi:MAG: PKD domain-containing protein [Candidatus Bipolaricaulota bacterium]